MSHYDDRIWLIVEPDTEPRWGGIVFAGSETGMKAWFNAIHDAHPDLFPIPYLKKRYGIVSRRPNTTAPEAGWFYPDVFSYEREFSTLVFQKGKGSRSKA